MTALLVLLVLGAVTWGYRVAFTAALGAERLPEVLRRRSDVVGPAAFAALVAGHVAATPASEVPAMLVAVGAAAVAAHRTGNHLLALVAAVVAWLVVAAVWGALRT